MSKKIHIRQKIKSVQTTKKITHALRLVSMSLYSKLEHQVQFVINYVDELKSIFGDLLQCKADWKCAAIETWQKPDACQIWVIVATSKGLCGSLNSNLFRYISKQISPDTIKNTKFVTIGQKASNFVRDNLNGEIIYSYNDFNSNNYLLIASDLITKMKDSKICFSSATLYFNEPKSFFLQKPSIFKLLPLSEFKFSKNNTSHKYKNEHDMIWEQNPSTILDFIFARFIESQISYIFLQALISEYAARFVAMDSSTNNAEKFLEKLTLQYNKIRQGTITREISELSASFMERQ